MNTLAAGLSLGILVGVNAWADPVGRLVAAHDANTLGSNLANADAARFAVNVAAYLTQGGGNRLLLIETEPPFASHDYAPSVEAALIDAGFDLTVVDARLPAPSFEGFDAVFVGIAARDDFRVPDAGAFGDYIRAGGGAYVFSGVGSDRIEEAAALNTMIGDFGILFDSGCGPGNGCYNGVNGVAVDPAAHPIFEGITTLLSGNGQFMEVTTGQVVAAVNGSAVYAVAEVMPCNPADLASPFGLLDLADITTFVAAFLAMSPTADLVPDDLFDLADINAFVLAFVGGCP